MMERGRHLDMFIGPRGRLHLPRERRIGAAVLIAPAMGYLFGRAGLSSVGIPIQLWRAGGDTTLVEPWNVGPIARDLPVPPDYHVVPNANHGDFGAPCAPDVARAAPVLCGSAAGFDRAAFHREFNDAVIAFMARALGGPSSK